MSCCAALYLKIDRNNKTAYTLGTMKYCTRKITAIVFVVALASLAGWFCVNLQGMQMSEGFLAMAMPAEMMDASYHYMNGVSHHAWVVCAFNCLSKSPQTIVAKKFSVDALADFLPDVFDNQTSRLLADSSGVADFSKPRPPVPDILSSVFKKE